MGLFGKKKKINNNKNAYARLLATLLGFSFLVLASIPLAKNISQQHKIDSEIKQLEDEISSVEDKNEGLRKVMDYMSSDQFVEEQARLKFGLQRPGEQAATVKDSGEEAGGVQTGESGGNSMYLVQKIDAGSARSLTNPEKWYRYFFNMENSVK